ncbi:RDD family protein [Variovorax saccharolyticus]|uniref:RDD family protein n=1 Tax=Variovorax saccharolyticus TaxID=3053516 RepID=UPI0025752DA3|nr:RDD family protein [Variovorax sp. J22R187]MDM0021356.1 RDD family protein [Variovorax sp. J22R187]
MQDGWWFASGEERNGPLSTEQLQALLDAGAVGPATLVWRPGRLAWKPVADVSDFHQDRTSVRVHGAVAEPAHRREPVFDLVTLPAPRLESIRQEDLPDWARTGAPSSSFPVQPAVLHLPLAGPWRRFFAQLLDIWSLCVPVGYLLGMVAGRFWPAFGLWMSSPSSGTGLGFLMIPLALIAQAFVFGLFGTTLGKVLFGVRVTLLGGARPTFLQYFGRLLGLYWAGLGLGVPFVNLVTMWRQYARVKSGQPASYDAARFQVHAVSMGAARRSVAAFCVVAMVAVFGYLQYGDSEANKKYFAGFEWINPISNKRVDIPPGWVFTQQVNAEGDPIFTFSSHAAGVVSVFALEDVDESVTLEQYQRAWISAVRPQMAIDIRADPINVKGRFGLQMRGVMVNNASRRIHTTLVKNGSQVWRVVSVGMNGREPESAATEGLRAALLQSLPDRPERPRRAAPTEGRGAAI